MIDFLAQVNIMKQELNSFQIIPEIFQGRPCLPDDQGGGKQIIHQRIFEEKML